MTRQREPRTTPQGPQSLSDILATAVAAGRVRDVDLIDTEPPDGAVTESADGPVHDELSWFLHETRTLREPIYRTEAVPRQIEPVGRADSDPEQLPLIHYAYDNGTVVMSRLGELSARDLRVMSVISQIFYTNGCPTHNSIVGDEATLGYIARQLGMNPDGCAAMIRASIERLATAKVVWRVKKEVVDENGLVQETDDAEVTMGFLANWGRRKRKVRGEKEAKTNFVQLDQIMAEMIRAGNFTWLRADVLRRLRDNPMAIKLYAFMRTHRPNDRGEIEYGAMLLAKKLGCSDTKKARVRAKLLAAAEAVCKAAPNEFPRTHLRPGMRDQVLVMAKNRRPVTPPLVVLEGEPQARIVGDSAAIPAAAEA